MSSATRFSVSNWYLVFHFILLMGIMIPCILHFGLQQERTGFHSRRSSSHMLSGPSLLLKITFELFTNLQNIWRRVVCWVFINVSPSNIFWKLLLLERYHQNSQAVLGPKGMNGLTTNQEMQTRCRVWVIIPVEYLILLVCITSSSYYLPVLTMPLFE